MTLEGKIGILSKVSHARLNSAVLVPSRSCALCCRSEVTLADKVSGGVITTCVYASQSLFPQANYFINTGNVCLSSEIKLEISLSHTLMAIFKRRVHTVGS